MDGEAYAINNNAHDTNLVNNVQAAGTLKAYTAISGDINGDGIVDIYDAIQLAGKFGLTSSSKVWNPDCDLNADGNVDIYDAIILAGHFNIKAP
jgi:hypothetical protein